MNGFLPSIQWFQSLRKKSVIFMTNFLSLLTKRVSPPLLNMHHSHILCHWIYTWVPINRRITRTVLTQKSLQMLRSNAILIWKTIQFIFYGKSQLRKTNAHLFNQPWAPSATVNLTVMLAQFLLHFFIKTMKFT
jgi:hypothetical protein